MKLIIRQKYFALNDNFSIYDENNQTRFIVKGEWSFFKKKLVIFDAQGAPLYSVISRFTLFFRKFDVAIGYVDGFNLENPVAKFREGLHWPFRRRAYFEFVDEGGVARKLKVTGSFIAFNWKIKDKSLPKNEQLLAKVNKKIFKIADTYTLETFDDKIPAAYYLIIGLLIDTMHHQGH